MSGCEIHGLAFTTGCPGCEDVADATLVSIRELDPCPGHAWVELEPTVEKCVRCDALRFTAATIELLERYLLDSGAAE